MMRSNGGGKGFKIRQVRKTGNSQNRETMVSIHQKKVESMDLSGVTDYYLNNGDILMRYFDLTDNPEDITEHVPQTIKKDSILDLIRKDTLDFDDNDDNDDLNQYNEEPYSDFQSYNNNNEYEYDNEYDGNHSLSKQIPLSHRRFHTMPVSEMNKSDLYEKYKSNINNDYIPEHYRKQEAGIRICPECANEATLIPSDAMMFCETCGWEDRVLVDVDLPGMKDQNKDTAYFNYRKINHFNEWLAQFQAKETTDIPQEVYDRILLEFRKERLRNISKLKSTKLREILKRLGLNKYYEHIPHIINRLNGIPPPRLSPETEETLRDMFRAIQTPFMNHCPSWRKNFLSYSYVLNKFCKILRKTEFLACFPLLKSREKLYEMDKVWQKICVDLGWEFHRSI